MIRRRRLFESDRILNRIDSIETALGKREERTERHKKESHRKDAVRSNRIIKLAEIKCRKLGDIFKDIYKTIEEASKIPGIVLGFSSPSGKKISPDAEVEVQHDLPSPFIGVVLMENTSNGEGIDASPIYTPVVKFKDPWGIGSNITVVFKDFEGVYDFGQTNSIAFKSDTTGESSQVLVDGDTGECPWETPFDKAFILDDDYDEYNIEEFEGNVKEFNKVADIAIKGAEQLRDEYERYIEDQLDAFERKEVRGMKESRLRRGRMIRESRLRRFRRR